MIIFFIILVIALIIGVSYYLSKIVKEQHEIVTKENKEEEEKRLARRTIADKIQENISEEEYKTLLEEIKNDESKMDELKHAIQNELRKAIKSKNSDKARQCNQRLKEIDQILKGIRN